MKCEGKRQGGGAWFMMTAVVADRTARLWQPLCTAAPHLVVAVVDVHGRVDAQVHQVARVVVVVRQELDRLREQRSIRRARRRVAQRASQQAQDFQRIDAAAVRPVAQRVDGGRVPVAPVRGQAGDVHQGEVVDRDVAGLQEDERRGTEDQIHRGVAVKPEELDF